MVEGEPVRVWLTMAEDRKGVLTGQRPIIARVQGTRRQGVYRALHEHVEQAARRRAGVCGLRLYVDRGNTAAQGVYRSLGMELTDYLLFEVDWSERG